LPVRRRRRPWIRTRPIGFGCGVTLGLLAGYYPRIDNLILGAQPPTPEWGAMVFVAKDFLDIAPHIALFPILAIFITVLGFNFLGDGLRDALDPRLS
jgi:ABC-type dipeptide/oligopeptide/nickel transport system permease subunit